ncbi:MAG: biotin/lipoyl-containing protein, partial [Candidatus Binataceae bacterium]
MSIEVTMPQMGESVVEGTVSKWLVKEGDVVTEDQPLCEISTDKVDTEIPSPGAGRIAKIVAQEGQTVPVGAALATIEAAGAPASEARAASAPAPKPVTKPAPAPTQIREIRPTSTLSSPPRVEARVEVAAPAMNTVGASDDDAHRRYSPVVLKMAAEHGIALARIPGTGIGGRVSKRDVTRYLDSLRASGAKSSAADGVATPAAAA